ncbi:MULTISPECIES: hypothetical protein [unclassified Methylobacterium]|uniref:hypothetical protein n=1 Tax=unclassified Methylobacterium TaxID=2615210 RepID=UPI001A9578B0|nr:MULTISPECIES: hypothetical protein [unclassified Methylobacterium]MBO1022826.1 hypothetical protein [Methylobacterium sp. SD274]
MAIKLEILVDNPPQSWTQDHTPVVLGEAPRSGDFIRVEGTLRNGVGCSVDALITRVTHIPAGNVNDVQALIECDGSADG